MREKKNYPFLTWTRVLGVFLILMCHFTQQSGNKYLIMSSQIFNIGNSLFFLLSGISFGIQGEITDTKQWFKKRIKRIYIPYEIVVLMLTLISIALGYSISLKPWLLQLTGMQGWHTIFGLAQTWFITSLILCYIITPVLGKMFQDCRRQCTYFFLSVLFVLPIIIAYSRLDTMIFTPLCWYAIAFFIGTKIESVCRTRKRALFSVFLLAVCFGIRLIFRFLCDGTTFYTYVIANYTHAIGAVCIIYFFMVIFWKRNPPHLVKKVSSISFEMYLWHYMFTDGPLRLFGIFNNWILSCILVFVITVLVSIMANWGAKKIELLMVRK